VGILRSLDQELILLRVLGAVEGMAATGGVSVAREVDKAEVMAEEMAPPTAWVELKIQEEWAALETSALVQPDHLCREAIPM